MKSLLLSSAFAVALLAPGCAAARATGEHPFGLWSTERGQTIEVFRNETFRGR